MGKKWSCPACDYKSGRQSNVSRHIGRKHGNYEVPVLTEVLNTDLAHQSYSRNYSDHYFPHLHQDLNNDILEKKKADSFITSYKFEDKKFGIYKKFLDALKLPASEYKNLIVSDLILQMKRAVSPTVSNRQAIFNGMTSPEFLAYPSPSDSILAYWQENGKLMESRILNNSESTVKSDSAVKANVSSDSHERKLQVALQRILDYGKERKKSQYIREFGDDASTRISDKSNLN